MSEANAKVCIKCGTDCSGKPRTKDAQGRYTCKACFDAAQKAAKPAPKSAAKPAPKPAPVASPAAEPADDAAIMASLLEGSPTALTAMCPSCGSGMPEGAAVCTICGYNTQTGKAVSVKVQKAEKGPRTGPGLRDYLTSPSHTAIAALVVFGGLFALGMANEAGAIAYVLLGCLYGFVFGLLLLIDAFRQGIVTGLLYLFVPFYALYYLLVKCESAMIKVHVCLSIVVMLGTIPLAGMLPETPA